MLYRLVRPVLRSDSSVPQFVQRIPADVKARAVGRTLAVPLGSETILVRITPTMASVRFSLRTQDPSEAKRRQGEAAASLETHWASLRRAKPATLTQRQATALAGDLYRGWADGEGRERTLAIVHTPHGWVRDRSTPEEERTGFASARASLEAATSTGEPADLEPTLGPLVDRFLLARGIASVDGETRPLLLDALARALRDAFAVRERNAEGDYSPDTKAGRFPEWQAPSEPETPQRAAPAGTSGKTTFSGLVTDWWAEAKAGGRKPATFTNYRNTIGLFAAFLKHDDAARVTADDVLRFKDHRLSAINPKTGKPTAAKTVRDGDLVALKTVFGWAVANRRLKTNPAAGLGLKLAKPPKLRSKGFTDAEARAILSAASSHVAGVKEHPETAAAKRWVPWLAAYTGARVGELAQLRKRDLRREGAHWLIVITPEAGTVKTNEAREVVLHPHLIELGFAEFVQGAPTGHLFLRVAKGGDVLGPLQGVKNRLSEFARAIVPDPNVAPNHGWRHRFKTVGMDAGIAPRLLDAIQGHVPRTAGDGYGEVSLKAMAEAVGRMPRIDCESHTSTSGTGAGPQQG